MIVVELTFTPPRPQIVAYLVIGEQRYYLECASQNFTDFLVRWQQHAQSLALAMRVDAQATAVAVDEDGKDTDWSHWFKAHVAQLNEEKPEWWLSLREQSQQELVQD